MLIYTEQHRTRSDALKREAEIKSLGRKQKLKLIEERHGNADFCG